jgi:hypothetical protein
MASRNSSSGVLALSERQDSGGWRLSELRCRLWLVVELDAIELDPGCPGGVLGPDRGLTKFLLVEVDMV